MPRKILLVGESWMSLGFHLKGFSTYTTGGYEEGGKPLIEALEGAGHSVEYIPNHRVPAHYPTDKADLGKYDAVIFSDVGADTFLLHPDTLMRSLVRPNTLQVTADYVADGGGLLMIGGFMSFSGFGGNARYQNTVLADVLPVTMLGYDDRIECPQGVTPAADGPHEVLNGINGDWPHLLGYQRVIAKPDATTILAVGKDPLLVLGQHGNGRTAAFTSDCSPHWGSPEFTGWKHYADFWSNLTGYLAG